MTLLAIVIASLMGGAATVLVAAVLARSLLERWLPHFLSYAVGVLLATAILDILPEIYASAIPTPGIGWTVIASFIVFIVLEKSVAWRHHTEERADTTQTIGTAGALVLFGDSLHGLVDGILIAAAFVESAHLGILIAAAVVTHEVPHKLGDFAVLAASGVDRHRALVLSMLAGLSPVVGGVLGYSLVGYANNLVPYVLAVAAASFIYISLATLIPMLNSVRGTMPTLVHSAFIVAGGTTIALGLFWLEGL